MDVLWIEGQCLGTRWTLVALADIRFLTRNYVLCFHVQYVFLSIQMCLLNR